MKKVPDYTDYAEIQTKAASAERLAQKIYEKVKDEKGKGRKKIIKSEVEKIKNKIVKKEVRHALTWLDAEL